MPENSHRQAICSRVARLLREERERQHLSLNALAERSGLSRQMVSFVEREERNPSLDTLMRLTEALRLTLSSVISKAERGESGPRQTLAP